MKRHRVTEYMDKFPNSVDVEKGRYAKVYAVCAYWSCGVVGVKGYDR